MMEVIHQHYPNPVEESHFIKLTATSLADFGFSADNTLPVLAVCRDEICASFVNNAEAHWGNSFTLGGLAGLPFGGKTEMMAASLHAPDIYDRERFVIYAMTHIGFGPNAEIGGCVRPGMNNLNSACGALIAYTDQLIAGTVDGKIYADDAEFGLLKIRMAKTIPAGEPDLLGVTNAALQTIKQDIRSLTKSVLDPDSCDYAVFTGTQIHLPDQNLVQASESWVVLKGQRRDINFNS